MKTHQEPVNTTRKSVKGMVTVGAKASSRRAADFSRKYVTLAQALAQSQAQATLRMLSKGRQRLPGTIRRQFLGGLRVIVPIGVTIFILVWIFQKIDGILQPLVSYAFGRTLPGVGVAMTMVLILIVGVIVSSIGGRKLLHYGESIISKVPVVRQLYYGIKQIVESFSSAGKKGFLQVVLVEFPKEGMKTLGFVTNETNDQSGKVLLNVFIPTAPNPTSGFLQIMTEEEVIRTDISVDDALKMVMSAGSVSAKEIADKLGVSISDTTEFETIQGGTDVNDKTSDRIGD